MYCAKYGRGIQLKQEAGVLVLEDYSKVSQKEIKKKINLYNLWEEF